MTLHISNSRNIKIKNILFCQAEGSYTYVNLNNNKKLLLTKRLGILQKELSKDIFFRCHKSYLINLNYVSEIFVENPCKVVLNETTIVDVSIRRKHSLIEQLQKNSLLVTN
jgi:two-component system, LytTR family, response regulator